MSDWEYGLETLNKMVPYPLKHSKLNKVSHRYYVVKSPTLGNITPSSGPISLEFLIKDVGVARSGGRAVALEVHLLVDSSDYAIWTKYISSASLHYGLLGFLQDFDGVVDDTRADMRINKKQDKFMRNAVKNMAERCAIRMGAPAVPFVFKNILTGSMRNVQESGLADFPDESDLHLPLEGESMFKADAKSAGFKTYSDSASITLKYDRPGKMLDTNLIVYLGAVLEDPEGYNTQFECYVNDAIGGNYFLVFRDVVEFPMRGVYVKYKQLSEYLHSQLDLLVNQQDPTGLKRVYAGQVGPALSKLASKWKEEHGLD